MHLVPTISFGVNLEIVDTEATVSVGVDAQAALELSLSASASATASNSNSAAQADLGGCVNVTTGLAVSAGADAGLFKLFDAGVTYQLWGDEWQLWGKCWDVAHRRRGVSSSVNGTGTGDWYADRGLGHRVPLSLFEVNLRKDHQRGNATLNSNETLASVYGSGDQDGQTGAAKNTADSKSKGKGDGNKSGNDDGSAFSLACPKLKPGAVQPLIQPQTVKGSRSVLARFVVCSLAVAYSGLSQSARREALDLEPAFFFLLSSGVDHRCGTNFDLFHVCTVFIVLLCLA